MLGQDLRVGIQASNVTVVNIDNGFGAGYLAAMINRLAWQERRD